MEVLDAGRMAAADRYAIETMSIPGLVLMENAGLRTAETLVDEIDELPDQPVVVLSGRGNNGGDGFVVARHLARLGVDAAVWLIGGGLDDLRGDAAAMASAWRGVGGQIEEVPDAERWEASGPRFDAGTVVVDALFGTGLSRPLEGLPARVVEAVNAAGAFVCAVDLPSGLFASEAEIPGTAVRADLTVTFARPKPAQLLPPAEELCGVVVVVDIGIPDRAIQEAGADLHWVTEADAAALLPEREAGEHKGHFGHVLVVAGAPGKAGAAALTGRGALLAGAGLVTVATPGPARPEVAGFAPELMTESLPAGREGGLARGASGPVLELAAARSVLALGPGLGLTGATATEIRRIVRGSRVPAVVDADGLNAFGGRHAGLLGKHRAPLVITPHPGEAARLAGVGTGEIQSDRVGWARRLARQAEAVCVLKGYRTITADPDGRAFINPTGNPGMGSGGMGDALTGMIAAWIGQGHEPLEAALLGVYLHGLAADLALEAGETEQTLTASRLLDQLPRAFRRLDEAASGEATA